MLCYSIREKPEIFLALAWNLWYQPAPQEKTHKTKPTPKQQQSLFVFFIN